MDREDTPFSPVEMTRDQKLMCQALERLHQWGGLTPDVGGRQQGTPTSMFQGALFAYRSDRRKNPDWIAQAAHSLREILHPFHAGSSKGKNSQDCHDDAQRHDQHATGDQDKARSRGTVSKRKREIYDALLESLSLTEPMGNLWEDLNGFAHHHRDDENPEHTQTGFEKLLRDFENIMGQFRFLQVNLCKLYDKILREGPDKLRPQKQEADITTPTGFSINSAEDLLDHLNDDYIVRSYFLGEADERWIGWFRENGIFGLLSKGRMTVPAEKPVPPEISYLFRMASRRPEEVTAIISEAAVNEESCDARAVWSLLTIISLLPAPGLVQLMPKIQDEGWVKILGKQGVREFRYHEIVDKVNATRDGESFLLLAEVLLTLRPKERLKRASFQDQNPFCFSDLSYKSFFCHLAGVGDDYVDRALSLVLRTLGGIIERRGRRGESAAFEIYDNLFLNDVNLFGEKTHTSSRTSPDNDAHKLAVALQSLTHRFISLTQSDRESLVGFCAENVDTLPDSWAAWRIQLFFWGSAPDIFRAKLHQALFRALTHDGIREFMVVPEYLHALGRSFSFLPSDDQRKFVRQALALARHDQYSVLVGRMLSMVHGCLTPEERDDAKNLDVTIDRCYKPEPLFGQMGGEPRFPKYPMSQDELKGYTVPDIMEQLKNAWRPDVLEKAGDGTWRFSSAEGVGYMLLEDIRDRPAEYAMYARLLFDRDNLDPHYTCVCLDEIRGAIRDRSEIRSQMDGRAIVVCCLDIIRSDKASPLDRCQRVGRDGFVSFLGWWPAVLFSAIDIVREMLRWKDGPAAQDLEVLRNDILDIVAYFLSLPVPPSPDEVRAAIPSGESTPPSTAEDDPIGTAINSMRGIAFEALVFLAKQEAGARDDAGQQKLADDTRDLFEHTLANTPTRAIMSMYGQYFLTLWTLDKQWATDLIARVFPNAPEEQHLFEAAWTGYLSRPPLDSIRADPQIQGLYRRGREMLCKMDRGGAPYRELSEELAYHAMAFFVWCEKPGSGHKIFASFWHQGSPDLRAVFVRRIGEIYFTDGDGRREEFKCKLRKFWCDAIKKQPEEVLRAFGHWINAKSDIIDTPCLALLVNKTLQKTDGGLSWSIGLERSIVDLAKCAPADTIEIARRHLRWMSQQDSSIFPPLAPYSDWFKAIRALYLLSPLKTETRSLVDELVMINNHRFQPLIKALSDLE